MEGDKRFRELIDRSLVEEVSEGERQLIHDHIRDCDGCKRYLELTARTIRGLREFTFTSEPDSNAQVREILAHHTETMRQHNVQFKVCGCICCSALDVNCGIGTCLPGGQAPDGPNAFRHCSSPGRRARLLAAAIFLLGLTSARGAW